MAFNATTGSADANAYITEAFADTHHADRGNTVWAGLTTGVKEAAIIRATDYIDKRFGKKFRGIRQAKDQALEWPRLDAFDDDGFLLSGTDEIPRKLQRATAEYALRAVIYQVLAPDPILPTPHQDMTDPTFARDTDVITGEISRTRDKVGPLEEDRWYETRSQALARNLGIGARAIQSALLNDYHIPEYPEADLWIEELIRSSMAISLSRGD